MGAGGSQQLRLFRRAIRDGFTVEARMHAADDQRDPPPTEAFRLLGAANTLADLCSPWGRA